MRGAKRLIGKLQRMKKELDTRPQQAVEQELRVVRNMQRQRISSGVAIGGANHRAYATGTLIRGLRVRQVPIPGGSGVSLKSEAPHSGYVEYGTGMRSRIGPEHAYWGVGKDYNPPRLTNSLMSAINRWMIVKGITPLTDSVSNSAWLIARQISRKQYPGRKKPPGTPAQPFFWQPLMVREHFIRRAVRNAVRGAVR